MYIFIGGNPSPSPRSARRPTTGFPKVQIDIIFFSFFFSFHRSSSPLILYADGGCDVSVFPQSSLASLVLRSPHLVEMFPLMTSRRDWVVSTLSSLPILRGFSRPFLCELSHRVVGKIRGKGEVVAVQGEEAKEMIFVSEGCLEARFRAGGNSNEEVIARIGPGENANQVHYLL